MARALLAGDERTGISLMRIDAGLDTGPILSTYATKLEIEETAGEVTARLTQAGARLIGELLERYLRGELVATSQPGDDVTIASKIEPEERELRFDVSPEQFVRRVHALSPRPGAFAAWNEAPFKVLRARPLPGEAVPGELDLENGGLVCGTGGGRVELIEVQPAGKRPMPGSEWARGRRGRLGALR